MVSASFDKGNFPSSVDDLSKPLEKPASLMSLYNSVPFGVSAGSCWTAEGKCTGVIEVTYRTAIGANRRQMPTTELAWYFDAKARDRFVLLHFHLPKEFHDMPRIGFVR